MAKRQRYVSDFVKRDRESKQRFVRLYAPRRGQKFRFKSDPATLWICCPVTGSIQRLATYQRRHQ